MFERGRRTVAWFVARKTPHELRIHYVEDHDGGISAEWQPTVNCEGFEGIVHGGIISTVLDEAMSKAVAATDYEALTGELRVRFRHHVGAGENLRIRGWVVQRVKRLVKTEDYPHSGRWFRTRPRMGQLSGVAWPDSTT